jgi:hypothetical protein
MFVEVQKQLTSSRRFVACVVMTLSYTGINDLAISRYWTTVSQNHRHRRGPMRMFNRVIVLLHFPSVSVDVLLLVNDVHDVVFCNLESNHL